MSELETKVAVLERDISQMMNYCDKIDVTMEKLTDISISLKQMLAVHEHKLGQHALADEDLYALHQTTNKRIDTLDIDLVKTKSKIEQHKWYFTAIAVMICFILYKMGLMPFMPPFLG
jgi:pyruvate kinase